MRLLPLPLALVSTHATFAARVPGGKSRVSVSRPSPCSCNFISVSPTYRYYLRRTRLRTITENEGTSMRARTYVNPVSSVSKTGPHPNLSLRVPRGGTILPSVRPSNRTGSVPGPALYAKVQSAHAARVGKLSSMRLMPSHQTPVARRNASAEDEKCERRYANTHDA